MESAVGSHVEVLKEGAVWITTTSQLHRSKMSERWLTLARESPTMNQSTADVNRNCFFLRACKVANGVRRKAQEYNLANFQMVTSAYSSSSGALGPNRSIIYRFSVHCLNETHNFYIRDEYSMLQWVAALKQALVQPSDDQTAELYAVAFERRGRPNRTASMTPSIARQTSALLCIGSDLITLLHPLTEEAMERWTADSLTHLAVNSSAQIMELHICDSCQPRDGGNILVTCPSGAQKPASSLITRLALQSCVRNGEREIVCEFQHVCETRFPSDSRPESRSSGTSSWCGSCGNLCDTTITPQLVGQLMKTSAKQQLLSIYDADEKEQNISTSRSFEESSRSTDTEGYMIMKSDDAEKTDRSGTMPTGATSPTPVPEKFRRTKSATFSAHSRLVRTSHHQQVSGTRSWNSSTFPNQTPKSASALAQCEQGPVSSKGDPTYMEPVEVKRRMSHLPDSIPQLKPGAERTMSGQSSTSYTPSEYYASSSVVSRKTSVENPSTTAENSGSGNSCCSAGSTSSASSSVGVTTATAGGAARRQAGENSETDEDGYSFMAFAGPTKAPLRPSMSLAPSHYQQPKPVVDEADAGKTAHRTRSSPSVMANNLRRHMRSQQPRSRTASPSFSELEKRAAAAAAKKQQQLRNKDEESGYVVPEGVPRRPLLRSHALSTSLPLPLGAECSSPTDCYMTLSCNGNDGNTTMAGRQKSLSSTSSSVGLTSGSPDSGIGQDNSLGVSSPLDQDQTRANKTAIIRKRVRQKNSLQRSRFSDEEPTHILLCPGQESTTPPLPPKPADLPPIRRAASSDNLLRTTPTASAPPRPPKPSASHVPAGH